MIKPMLATPGSLPSPAVDDQWAYEMKWDGVRAIVEVSATSVQLWSRNENDVTAGYPELRGLAGRNLVLDGEIVAFDAAGRVSFAALQQRMHVRGASAVRALVSRVPVTLLVFDLLEVNGASLLDLPYVERRARLEELGLVGPCWGTPPAFLGGGGSDALQLSRAQGLEGVVAKKMDSCYEPGRRSACWLKVKHVATQEVVIGGWKPGEGSRSGRIGSLLCGLPSNAGLVYIGNVGSGFTSASLAQALALLEPLETSRCPFLGGAVPGLGGRGARWVRPELVAEVSYGNWTPDDKLRHPVWKGWRPDKSPAEVAREV